MKKTAPALSGPKKKSATIALTPLDQRSFCMPDFATAQSILRNKKENRAPIALNKTEVTPRFFLLGDLFIVERIGNERYVHLTVNLSKCREALLRNNTNDNFDFLQLAQSLLILGMNSGISEEERLELLGMQTLYQKAFCQLASSLGVAFYSAFKEKSERDSEDLLDDAAKLFMKAKRLVLRLRDTSIAETEPRTTTARALLAIETARHLCIQKPEDEKEDPKLPTKTAVRDKMEERGWGIGKTKDLKARWRETFESAGLGCLPD